MYPEGRYNKQKLYMAIILIPMYKTHGLDNDSNIVLFMSMAAYGIARSIKDKGDFRDREKRFVGIINSTGKETSWERLIIRRVPGGYSVIQMHMHLYKNTVIKDEEVAYFVK